MVKRRPNVREDLLAACDRLLTTEEEIKKMPKAQRRWFFKQNGHLDCFLVARALKEMLTREWD